jgi:hypothetical protein
MRFKTITLSLIALLAGGCGVTGSLQKAPAPVVVATPPADSGEAALSYFEHVRKSASADLAKEYDAVRQLYTRSQTDDVRMRYAILLSVPGTPFNDEARALQLLDPLIKNTDARLHGVALMLAAQVQDQRHSRALQQKLDALMSIDKDLVERTGKAEGKR